MKLMTLGLVLAVCLFGAAQPSARMNPMTDVTAATYEHLATAIIEIRATEDSLVKGMLMHSYQAASNHLDAAMRGRGSAGHLERAASEITDIANEGAKPIQAIRQRLLKAGHHHHTDAETKEDYMFIDSAEKRALLDLARKISRLGRDASDADIRQLAEEFDALFHQAIAAE